MNLEPALAVCHECDLVNQVPAVPPGGCARCARCGHLLYRNPTNCIDKTVALTVSALVLWLVANVFPFLAFGMPGNLVRTNLISGTALLYEQGNTILAFVVLVTSIVAPIIQIAGLLYVLAPLRLGLRLPGARAVLRFIVEVRPWSMMEVFLLGILVAMVKLGGMADVIPGAALWAFCCLIVVLTWALSTMEPYLVWEALDEAEEVGRRGS